MPSPFVTQVAKSTPFDNSINGFTADDTQTAIEEAKATGGVARWTITLIYNGVVGNNDWISYSNLTPDAKIVMPHNSVIEEFTWANKRTSIDMDFVFYKNGIASGNIFRTYSLRNTPNDYGYETGWMDSFVAGDWIRIQAQDFGINMSDAAFNIYMRNI